MLERDSRFLARLADGGQDQAPGREVLNELSGAFRPLAARLLAAAPEERQPLWDAFLAGRLMVDGRRAETTGDPRGRRIRITCARDVKTEAVEWLWRGRVPLGMLTMFAGDPKLGKSYVTLAMAAAVSRGEPLPASDLPDRPGSAILMSAEDDAARTIVPRLKSAGADLAKVHILESVILADGAETLPSLRADALAIREEARRLGDCRLIIVDPVSAYLKGVDDNRNTALRGVLAPLKGLAQELGAAVVLVSHLTKASTVNGKHRVLGSIAYVGACRANFLFTLDPQDPTGRRVLMIDNGGNVAPPAPALAFVIEDRDSGPRLEWSDGGAAVLVGLGTWAGPGGSLGRSAKVYECARWLSAYLSAGAKCSSDVFRAGAIAGFSRDQLRVGKSHVGAIAHKEHFGRGARWIWQLHATNARHTGEAGVPKIG